MDFILSRLFWWLNSGTPFRGMFFVLEMEFHQELKFFPMFKHIECLRLGRRVGDRQNCKLVVGIDCVHLGKATFESVERLQSTPSRAEGGPLSFTITKRRTVGVHSFQMVLRISSKVRGRANMFRFCDQCEYLVKFQFRNKSSEPLFGCTDAPLLPRFERWTILATTFRFWPDP